jgi:hypothetical protein
MPARRKNGKRPMRTRERRRNLVTALGDSYASAKYHKKKAGSQDPGGSSKPGQNASPPHNNLLGCGESCKLCFVKYSMNLCPFEPDRPRLNSVLQGMRHSWNKGCPFPGQITTWDA